MGDPLESPGRHSWYQSQLPAGNVFQHCILIPQRILRTAALGLQFLMLGTVRHRPGTIEACAGGGRGWSSDRRRLLRGEPFEHASVVVASLGGPASAWFLSCRLLAGFGLAFESASPGASTQEDEPPSPSPPPSSLRCQNPNRHGRARSPRPLLLRSPHHNHRDAAIDPSDPPFFDPDLFSDDLPLPADPSFDDFDIDVDFSVDDFLLSPSAATAPRRRSSTRAPAAARVAGLGHSAAGSPDSGVCAEGSGKARRGVKRKKQKEDAGSRTLTLALTLAPNRTRPRASTTRGRDEDKRKARLMRNRESAQLSRQRKKLYVEELEEKVKSMHSTINELNAKISYIMAENLALRQQVGGNAGPNCPPNLFTPWRRSISLGFQLRFAAAGFAGSARPYS
uniref:BZIP domain-containing protein n=1 Tax=Ananas comosus var. bracteatus TaxID=296719 RepID=A0A6V7PE30_ANACO|nr:unnamed protein product [Ananas comosus var. bracteatus]